MTILFFIGLSRTNIAQEIDCEVNLITEGLNYEQQSELSSFKSAIENYVNTNKFSNVDWEGPKILVSISIQLIPSGRDMYSANMFIVSKRSLPQEDLSSVAMQFEDRGKWNFEYRNGLSLSYDYMRYDNIASVIDFYMLMIIGLDLDSYGELDGDQCFQRALNIQQLAANRNANGWEDLSGNYGRQTMINNLSTPRLDAFRKLVFEYYVDGLDIYYEDKAKALKNVSRTIHKMADFKERYVDNSYYFDSWFASKCQELCEIFRGYKDDPKLFRDLFYMDPTNTVRYEAARDTK